jgi:acyl-CoA synthetase (AMP-forming)/AMP-acid ligase II
VTVQEFSNRFRRCVDDDFAILSMKRDGQESNKTIFEPEHAYSLDKKSRVIIDGSPEFVFRWMLSLDGLVERILLAPKGICRLRREALKSCADYVLVESLRISEEWDSLPKATGRPFEILRDGSGFLGQCDFSDVSVRCETQWVLATSGTTGAAKLVGHKFDVLTRSIRRDERYRGFRWALMYDLARFAGLQVFLQAAVSGSVLLAVDLEESRQKQVDWLINHRCNAISATPSCWRQLLMTDRIGELPLRQITLGGEIADEGLLNCLAERFPQAHICHVYASTEGGVSFSVHDKMAGFSKSLLNGGSGTPGLAVDRDGVLWVLGRQFEVLEGVNHKFESMTFESEPESVCCAGRSATCESLAELLISEVRNDGGAIGESDPGYCWINTGDKVEILGDRVFFVGRIDGAINVGGNKYFPEQIEAVVRQVDGVADVLVRGRPSSILGNLVEALVKLVPSVADESSVVGLIRAHCQEKLAPYQCPAIIQVVADLPVSESGKLRRVSS